MDSNAKPDKQTWHAGPFPNSRAAMRRAGRLRVPKRRGMGITRKPSSKRLPRHVMLQRFLNPPRYLKR